MEPKPNQRWRLTLSNNGTEIKSSIPGYYDVTVVFSDYVRVTIKWDVQLGAASFDWPIEEFLYRFRPIEVTIVEAILKNYE